MTNIAICIIALRTALHQVENGEDKWTTRGEYGRACIKPCVAQDYSNIVLHKTIDETHARTLLVTDYDLVEEWHMNRVLELARKQTNALSMQLWLFGVGWKCGISKMKLRTSMEIDTAQYCDSLKNLYWQAARDNNPPAVTVDELVRGDLKVDP